jgi:glycosyltransferase involved in cell wall biosynthesis
MKIQFITTHPALYGANRSLLALLENFIKEGHDISVLVPAKGSMSATLKEKDIKFNIIPYYCNWFYIKPNIKYLLHPILTVLTILLLPIIILKIKKFNPDIIYSNASADNMGIIISKILHKKHILHIREFLSKDYNLYFILGKKAKRKYITLSDGNIFVSQAVAKYTMEGIPLSKKQTIIYNGFPVQNYSLSDKKLPKKLRFGIVGVLDKSKGQDIAIEYFYELTKIFPTAELHIFGNGTKHDKAYLVKLIHKFNLTRRVFFHGFIKDEKNIYSSFDILMMFSRSEGFGRVTVEAMLNGIPVIGFNNAGTSELIKHEKTGYLFNDLESFIQSAKELYNETKFSEIRENAYNEAQSQFAQDEYYHKVKSFIDKVHSTR